MAVPRNWNEEMFEEFEVTTVPVKLNESVTSGSWEPSRSRDELVILFASARRFPRPAPPGWSGKVDRLLED